MKQKSAYELIRIKGHFFDFIVFFPILVGKSNPVPLSMEMIRLLDMATRWV